MAPCIVPQVVIREILANLDIQDLLNCRLVNGTWNTECVSILRKSKYSFQVLSGENIAKFLEFAVKTRFHPLLQFHVQFKDATSIILATISKLTNHFGPACIGGLTLECKVLNDVELADLFEILYKVALGLRFIDVKKVYVATPSNGTTTLALPNLEALSCADIFSPEFNPLNELVLAGATSKLTFLSIPRFCSHDLWPLPPTQLRSLTIGNLQLMSPPTSLVEAIPPNSPTTILHLRVLDIFSRGGSYFHSFLACLAKGLKSLAIPAKLFKHERFDEALYFPDLPNLKHLEISESKPKLIAFQTSQVNFIPSAFPALTSVRIPLSLLPVQSETRWGLRQIIRSGEKFWVVTSLDLDVTLGFGLDYPAGKDKKWKAAAEGEEDYKVITMKSILENLLEMFPSTLRLSLHVKQKSYNPTLKLVLKELLLSPLSGGIRELWIEVRGKVDCFGQVLQEIQQAPKIILENFHPSNRSGLEKMMRNAFKDYAIGFSVGVLQPSQGNQFVFAAEAEDKPNIYMLGLEKFRYFPPRETDKKNKSKVFHPDLSLLSSYLPAVAEVGLPFQSLGKDDSARRKALQNLRKTYPSLNLNFIYNNKPQCSFHD